MDKFTNPYLIVFVSNFCVMTLELVAGRLIAPYVGVSVFTWTGVIGIILLGITLGNYFGGKAADNISPKRILGPLLLVSAITSFLSVIILGMVSNTISLFHLPIVLQVFIVTLSFLPASFFLGTISPIVAKLAIKNLKKAGETVGKIYAVAALGSIVGTYTTGFYLISHFGTKSIVFGVFIILATLSIPHFQLAKLKRIKIKKLLLTSVLTPLMVATYLFSGIGCNVESNYYCIRVDENGKNLKTLFLDKLTHSFSDLNNPLHLEYVYAKFFAAFYEYFENNNQNSETLFIGGGGYTLPRYLINKYDNPDITVVEIDPEVTKIAIDEFGMPKNSTVTTFNQDARMFFRDLDSQTKYSLIFGDAFSDLSIPYHLATLEFSRDIKSHLTNDGYYVVNLIDTYKPGLFLKSYITTLNQVFEHVYLIDPLAIESGDPRLTRSTFIVIAGAEDLSLDEISKTTQALGYSELNSVYYTEQQIRDLLLFEDRAVVITDDFAPVDNLISPAFATR